MVEYEGNDLIIAMGAPGSRWSGSIRAVQASVDINTSDDDSERIYDLIDGEMPLGWHRGAYWGPNHEFGHNFDCLDELTKEEVIEEFTRPFTNWEPGIKIIKSHWFSYHIPLLREWFPQAKLIAFYMPDNFCFDWWHKVGGWNITYPHYEWYENDERMRSQIEIENACIQQYFPSLENLTLEQIHQQLGVSTDLMPDDKMDLWDQKLPQLRTIFNKSNQEVLNSTVHRTFTGII